MRPKIDPSPLVLLDTHIWYWLMNGELEKRSASVWRDISGHLDRNAVCVSVISVWEMAVLESRKRIALNMDCLSWCKRALAAPGVELEELSPEVAVASTRLPETGPKDPADRIILATAMDLGAVLVTCDREMTAYAETHDLPVLTF